MQIDDTERATAANIKAIARLGEFVIETQENETVLNEWRDDIRSQFEYLFRAQKQNDEKLKLLSEEQEQQKMLLAAIKRRLENDSQN